MYCVVLSIPFIVSAIICHYLAKKKRRERRILVSDGSDFLAFGDSICIFIKCID